MNEWKELRKDNLPSDILTGDYEFEYLTGNSEWLEDPDFNVNGIKEIIEGLLDNVKYRYRKPEPLPPTHHEIMTKWWKYEEDWIKVFNYNLEGDQKPYGVLMAIEGFQAHEIYRSWLDKEWFTNRESAKIPPEAS